MLREKFKMNYYTMERRDPVIGSLYPDPLTPESNFRLLASNYTHEI